MNHLTASPTGAARAAQETREQAIGEAFDAFEYDYARAGLKGFSASVVTLQHIAESREFLRYCLSHLDEIERHLPSSARQGQVRDVAEGDPAYLEEDR